MVMAFLTTLIISILLALPVCVAAATDTRGDSVHAKYEERSMHLWKLFAQMLQAAAGIPVVSLSTTGI